MSSVENQDQERNMTDEEETVGDGFGRRAGGGPAAGDGLRGKSGQRHLRGSACIERQRRARPPARNKPGAGPARKSIFEDGRGRLRVEQTVKHNLGNRAL